MTSFRWGFEKSTAVVRSKLDQGFYCLFGCEETTLGFPLSTQDSEALQSVCQIKRTRFHNLLN
jgi:hypothetical protein